MSYKLTIRSDNKSVEIEKGINLLEAITKAGIQIASPCGGEGNCGKCRVVVESEACAESLARVQRGQRGDGLSPLTDSERSVLNDEQIKSGSRLACQAKLIGDATITIPDASRVSDMRILLSGSARPVRFNPSVSKNFVQLPKQKLEKAISAYAHLKFQLDGKAYPARHLIDLSDAASSSVKRRVRSRRVDCKANVSVLRDLATVLHKSDGDLTAVCYNDKIIAVEQGDTTDECYGIALDVGTTTIVGTLINLTNGKDIATASMSNPQAQYGHDVISRINFTIENEEGLDTLQNLVVGATNQIIDELAESAEISSEQIYEMAVVGNSTMYHLLLGIFPRSLGIMPYIPVVSDSVNTKAGELGIQINPNANIHVLPNIAGFIGADTVGAILAADLDHRSNDKISMLVDIGTNCEIVLKKGEELIACSTAAGPAFEGAKIKHGIYAGPGAIEKIALNDDCEYKVIGNKPPTGICGSAIVDIGAGLLKTGIVDQMGKMLSADELPDGISPLLKQRLIEGDDGVEFVVARASRLGKSTDGENITVTQRDFRELQLGKAAIRTGIEVLLSRVGIELEQVDELLIAGGFGNYINKENAVRLGMLPNLPLEKIKFIGNAAVVGAKLALISREARASADRISQVTQHVQVADTPDFQMQFMEAMLFD